MPRPKRTGKTAAVEVVENVPVSIADEVLIAQHEGRRVKSEEKAQGEDGEVMTTHTRPGTVVMYKPTESHGYTPRTVSVSAIRLLLRQGWRDVCPDCRKRHIDTKGVESTDPNLCSARDPVAVRVCRVCTKRIYDNRRFTFDGKMGGDDENVIEDESYEASTPEERTKASLDLHYWTWHPREAAMMKVPPLPAALQPVVPGETRVGK